MKNHPCTALAAGLLFGLTPYGLAQAPAASPVSVAPATLTINAATPGAHLNPFFYGLMTEEINHSYDGGLYAELIQNRSFRDDPAAPAHWSLVQGGGGTGGIALDTADPLSQAQPVSLKVTVGAGDGRVGAANDGYWGVPVTPGTRYKASLYARASGGFAGPLAVDLESADGSTVYAQARIPKVTGEWRQYAATLTTGRVAPTAGARFVVSASSPGVVNLALVSLFPPTYHGRANGDRIDLMDKLAGLNPSFLRLPGGDYLEGETVATRFDWKRTIGPLAGRPGHEGPWGYRSSDGLGLLEYLEWCEDLHMHPLLAVYAGYSRYGHKNPNPERVLPGSDLAPYVQDALDEIEYVTGGPETRWGAERIKDGHPAPFPLEYVEVGNEDFFDKSGSYDGRFAQFFDAIRAKYPKLQVIATTPVKSRVPDVLDEHFYRRPEAFEADVHHYDTRPRTGPKVFVGEWASRVGTVTPNLGCALGDGAWLSGLERNTDLVVLESYAPLFVNVNPGAGQWKGDLIGYDALTSFGSPSYYVQAMFDRLHGDTVLPAALDGGAQLFESVTRDSKTGAVYLHVTNAAGAAQPVHVTLSGVKAVSPTGTATVLSGTDPSDTNSLAEPTKLVPVAAPVGGLGPDFTYTFAPYSVTVLELRTK